MQDFDRKSHWENIYETKPLETVSWYQPNPQISLDLIADCNLKRTSTIIDVGAGDSYLIEKLIELGYKRLNVLDISHKALERAIDRMENGASRVNWIEFDAVDFRINEKFDLWHDRAAFHFLKEEQEISSYIENAYHSLKPNGSLIVGTFSDKGPDKCSGIEVSRYSITDLIQRFHPYFICLDSHNVDHETPTGKTQSFTFCRFRKV